MPTIRLLLFLLLLALSATPWITPPIALALGLLLGLTIGTPFPERRPRWTKLLLQASVVGLGFGMSLEGILAVGLEGGLLAVGSVVGTLLVGSIFARLLGVDRTTGDLVVVGTAICGGSAIAAVGPAIEADAQRMSVALGVVFVLNALALFLFPLVGEWLALSGPDFGLWAAVAIHDTSSVVGAASAFGKGALEPATTVKLARALLIVPLVLVAGMLYRRRQRKEGSEGGSSRIKIPWFILFFIIAFLLRTLLGDPVSLFSTMADVARQALVVTLFLIGAGLSREQIRTVGPRPALLGILLWIVVASLTLGLIVGVM